jgi:hypothetical protein
MRFPLHSRWSAEGRDVPSCLHRQQAVAKGGAEMGDDHLAQEDGTWQRTLSPT